MRFQAVVLVCAAMLISGCGESSTPTETVREPQQTASLASTVGTIITVNSTADADGINGNCTLREALIAANANASSDACLGGNPAPDVDRIEFDLSGTGVQTINAATTLPPITEALTVDGYSQPGAAEATSTEPATLLIELKGAGLGIAGSPPAENVTIQGLVINEVSTSNGIGIFVSDGTCVRHTVRGNYLGVDPSGTTSLGNGASGVEINGASCVTVGGTSPADRNVISGNVAAGVEILHSTNITVQGNYIGTDASGTESLGNGTSGIRLAPAWGNMIGGTDPGAGNVISANNEGIAILLSAGLQSDDNVVQGNFIGTDVSGTEDLGNFDDGIRIIASAGNVIGGGTSAARNIIAGNGQSGIRIDGVESAENVIQGNFIGTDVTGTKSLGNGLSGIRLAFAFMTSIGGTASGQGNVIGANAFHGIQIRGQISTQNIIQGNYIGTDASGELNLSNTGAGVRIVRSQDNVVGGVMTAASNVIAFNSGNGVEVSRNDATGNSILGNQMYRNVDIGIDLLGLDETDPNDPGDDDAGPNHLQNFPVIATARQSGEELRVTYRVDSDPATVAFPLRVEFFKADDDEEEGALLIGIDEYSTTDFSGCGTPPCAVTAALGSDAVGFIVATATNASGNTSEFSGSLEIEVAVATPVDIDIKPESFPNSFSLDAQGRMAVAILTSPEFDATDVNAATVTLGNDDSDDTPVALRQDGTLFTSLEDVDKDGDTDRVVHFEIPALVDNGDLSTATSELHLNGKTADGGLITGSDSVNPQE